jgi:hypothetical protein
MHGWPWSLELDATRRDRSGALLILAVFGFVLGGWIAIATWDRDVTDTGRDRARALADDIRALAIGSGLPCGDALARLPFVRDAASLRQDPWGNAWSIRCHGDLAIVRSAGADGLFGAQDDIVEVAVTPPQGDP